MDEVNFRDTYSEYFEIIDEYLGSIKHYLGDDLESHIDLGHLISTYPHISDLILDSIYDLDEAINKYWRENAKGLIDEISQDKVLKCLYSGKLSPTILESFVKKSALYIDTIIIPDPIFDLISFSRKTNTRDKNYLFQLVKNVFNIWKLKELILANSEKQILVILPVNLDIVNKKSFDGLFENGNTSFVNYSNKLFDKEFTTREEVLQFTEPLDDLGSTFSLISNKDLLPTEIGTIEKASSFLSSIKESRKVLPDAPGSEGWHFAMYLSGQFIRVQEHLYFCEKLFSEPIYDYELPWFFMNYELGGSNIDSGIINALQKDQFEWLSNVPLEVVKILREENELEYMREIFRKGLTNLKVKNDQQLIETSKILESNLKEAFQKQKSEISEIRKKVDKITKKEIPITSGTNIAGFIPFIGNIISIFSAGRDLKNLLQERKQLVKEIEDRENNPINLLLKSYE